MRREIKFRAWVPKSEEFIIHEAYMAIQGTPDIETLQSFMHHYSDEKNLMQFTGLLDKNGKEIYEGDVVSNHAAKWEIIFHTGCFCGKILSERLRVDHDIHIVARAIKEIEVIGNIYENPELIKS